MGALAFSPISWQGDRLVLLDQRRLPGEEVYLECHTWLEVADAIRTLAVRGAPAIGVAAAFGVALAGLASPAGDADALLGDLETASSGLAATRPTAVNLFWALERMRRLPGAVGRSRRRRCGRVSSSRRRRSSTRTSRRTAAWARSGPSSCPRARGS